MAAVVHVGVVDVYVIHVTPRNRWRILTLRRAPGSKRSPGSWETVHGGIDRGETPPEAALRELWEETGLEPDRLYSVTAHPFYLYKTGMLQIAVAFAAFVHSSDVTVSEEHDRYEWLTVAQAAKRFTWPREVETLAHIRKLLSTGDAGPVEDVLRMPLA